MSYKEEYLGKILEINEFLSKEEKIDDSKSKQICDYFTDIKKLGHFSIDNWKKEWKTEIYKFGEYFKKNDPSIFFSCIDKAIEATSEESELEVLDFIKSEIYVNFFPEKDAIKYFKELSVKYPFNPEFKNSLSICYSRIGKKRKSINYLKQAIKLDKKNQTWLDTIYSKEYAVAEELIQQKKHDKAEKYIVEIIASKFYLDHLSNEYQNFFIFLKQRNNDQLLIENKLSIINQNSKNVIDSLFEKTQIKLIEILGFFTAIIAFVFGTITIAVKVDLPSSLILISSFGFIMIIFILSLSILFIKNDKRWFEDKRVWVLCLIVVLNFLLIYFSKLLINWISLK